MKLKKFFLTMGLIVTVAFACFAASWTITDDSCKKCKITDIERECGKCGGFMESGKGEVKGDYLVSPFKCKKCNHTCKAKTRYQ